MATETAEIGATPSPAPTEAKSVQTAPAPKADAGSLQQPTSDFDQRVANAKTPAEIRALTKEAMKLVSVSKEPAPAEAPPAAAEAAPEPEVPVVTDPESTDPEATEPATEEPAATEEPEADDEGDSLVQPAKPKKLQLRLPEDDVVGRIAAALLHRNRDWTMGEAFAAAQKQMGVKPAAEAKADEPADSGLPKTVSEVDAAIKQLRIERRKANTELRFEEATDYSEKLEDLIQHRSTLERDGERRQQTAIAEYQTKFAAAEAKAVNLYAFAAAPDSPGGKRMREIEDVMEETGDPLFHSPDKPLRIAQMVAAELKIAPRSKGAPPAPTKAAAPAQPPKPKQMLPSGASRTTQPVANAQPAIDAEIAKVRTMSDMYKLKRSLGIPIR